jgi:amino acid transporter
MTDLSALVGVAVLFVSVATGALALYLLRGSARLDSILSAFAQVTVVPARRRRFLLLLWVEVVCFLVTGVLLGLYRLGVQLTSDPDLLYTASFFAGMATLGALVYTGLSPRRLTELERAAAEQEAPTILESLWMVPYRRMDDPPPKRGRS